MKLIVVLCCVMVVKCQNYAYQDHVPAIKDGVPLDTPEVQAAKAAHFEAYARAKALAERKPSNGQYEENVSNKFYTQPTSFRQVAYQQPSYQQYQPYQNGYFTQPKQYSVAAYSSALPVDTPEVQQARAAHFAALTQTQTHHFRFRRSFLTHEIPQETPEVQLAKYQHLVAHASVHDEDDDDYYPAPDADYFHVPLVTKKGVPVNTGAVKAAKQQHNVAVALAKAGVQYSGGFSVHEPVIGPNGVPFDTPEVYIAKVQHQAALAKESTKQSLWGLQEYAGGY